MHWNIIISIMWVLVSDYCVSLFSWRCAVLHAWSGQWWPCCQLHWDRADYHVPRTQSIICPGTLSNSMLMAMYCTLCVNNLLWSVVNGNNLFSHTWWYHMNGYTCVSSINHSRNISRSFHSGAVEHIAWFVIVSSGTYLLSLVPRLSCMEGGERAWYTLFAHVPSSLGNLHTTPLH